MIKIMGIRNIIIITKVEDGRDGGNPEFDGDVQDQYQDEVLIIIIIVIIDPIPEWGQFIHDMKK